MSAGRGIVYLVGAGPGDPGLITVRGRDLLRRADVVVFDRLIDSTLLDWAPPNAERIDAGKAPGRCALRQDEINVLLVDRARLGNTVVRLKGGDPFVFGRGSEELEACRDAGVPCMIVPGVTSAIAAPAVAGVAVTQRGVARSFAVITAQGGDGAPCVEHEFTALARLDTLVVMMGCAAIADWTAALLRAGKPADTPVACIASATTARQRIVTAGLGDIADAVRRAELTAPMVAVVGETARTASMDAVRDVLPLADRRIVLTAAADTNRQLADALTARGAMVITTPLIRIDYSAQSPDLRQAIQRIASYDWIAFTSRHAVIAFFRCLCQLRLDARALASNRIAVVGRGTARALARRRIQADLMPDEPTADGLADALLASGSMKDVLHPRSAIASGVLAARLRAAGIAVDDPVAYDAVEAPAPPASADPLRRACDAIVLCSPSAAKIFARRYRKTDIETVIAIGPVTADAARRAGIEVQLVADAPAPEAVAAALERYFASAGVSP